MRLFVGIIMSASNCTICIEKFYLIILERRYLKWIVLSHL